MTSLIEYLVLFGIPTIIIILFVLIIILALAVFFHFRRGQRVDALKLLFSEMVELAKINYEPHMLHLFRLDMPSMIDYLKTINQYITTVSQKVKNISTGKSQLKKNIQKKEYKETLLELEKMRESLEDYNARISRNKRGIYKGAIVGFNRINLYSSFEDIYQPEENGLGYKMILESGSDIKEYRISNREYEDVQSALDKCGGFINIVVYETIYGWKLWPIWRNKLTKAILCFDDQIIGRESEDGIVTILASGTESHGFYFEIPTSCPDRTKVIISVIKSLTWIRAMAQTQSNIFELINNSLNMNPTLLQTLAVKQMEKPIAKPVKTE